MPNEDYNEFLFYNNVPIKYQETSNSSMEASWALLNPQLLTHCDIW